MSRGLNLGIDFKGGNLLQTLSRQLYI
ncbi:hypothetical protein [Thermovirga lienii]